MELKALPYRFTVCKLLSADTMPADKDFYFAAKTDEEISLVCKCEDVPGNTTVRDDGWKGFRIEGVLDFSLIGVLSKISVCLAANNIGIFVLSTYHTDYILTKTENFLRAIEALTKEGYSVI